MSKSFPFTATIAVCFARLRLGVVAPRSGVWLARVNSLPSRSSVLMPNSRISLATAAIANSDIDDLRATGSDRKSTIIFPAPRDTVMRSNENSAQSLGVSREIPKVWGLIRLKFAVPQGKIGGTTPVLAPRVNPDKRKFVG